MLKQLKFKNDVIPGYFIDQNGKIYDSAGVEQEQKLYSSRPYYHFKSHEVHKMIAHSFWGYKKGFDIHHLNQIKTDNRLENICYLTRGEHRKLHMTGKKYGLGKKHVFKHSEESKQKMSRAKKGKKRSEQVKQKIRNSIKKKQVYCVELKQVFAGVNIAAKELSLPTSSISKCCQGKLKSTRGYHFKYYEGDLDF